MNEVTIQEARKKIYRYCAYQERSHKEVKAKLYSYGLRSGQVDELVVSLISEGFLNEERFARAFAGGKFRMKKWGRLKIVRELEAHDVTRNCIKLALKEIDPHDYADCLQRVLEKKIEKLDMENRFVIRDRAARYAISRGFEPDLVWERIKELVPD